MTRLITIFFCLTPFFASAQNLNWIKLGGTTAVNGNVLNIATAHDDGLITCGLFNSAVDIDPGEDEFWVEPDSSGNYVYVQKLLPTGNFSWGLQLRANSAAVDVDVDGNILIAGSFTGTTDFDPGSSEFIMTSGDVGSTYILKLSPAGEFIWAEKIDTHQISGTISMRVNEQNKIAIASNFSGSTDLDPGSEEFWVSTTFYASKCLLQLDADGNFIWGNAIISNQMWEGDSKNTRLRFDLDGNVYFGATFYISINFTPEIPGNAIAANNGDSYDNFIVKYDTNGEVIWHKIFGSNNDYDYLRTLAVDSNGNVYCAGRFDYYIDFDGGTYGDAELVTTGLNHTNGYFAKYNSDGSFAWSQAVVGQNFSDAYTLEVNSDNELLCIGAYSGQIDTDTSPGVSLNTTFPNGVYIFKTASDSTQLGYQLFNGITSMSAGWPVHLISPLNNDNGFYFSSETYMPVISSSGGPADTLIQIPAYENHTFAMRFGECMAYGCIDPLACNYDPTVICDDSTCSYAPIGDLDGDCITGTSDLLILLANFGCISDCPEADLNGDGLVTVEDIILWIGG